MASIGALAVMRSTAEQEIESHALRIAELRGICLPQRSPPKADLAHQHAHTLKYLAALLGAVRASIETEAKEEPKEEPKGETSHGESEPQPQRSAESARKRAGRA